MRYKSSLNSLSELLFDTSQTIPVEPHTERQFSGGEPILTPPLAAERIWLNN